MRPIRFPWGMVSAIRRGGCSNNAFAPEDARLPSVACFAGRQALRFLAGILIYGSLGDSATVARLALDQVIKVRVLVPQDSPSLRL